MSDYAKGGIVPSSGIYPDDTQPLVLPLKRRLATEVLKKSLEDIPRGERLRRLKNAFNRPPLLSEDVIRECFEDFGVTEQGEDKQ